MKKSSLILTILMISLVPTAVILQSATPAKAWGLATHMFIVSEIGENISNSTWAEVYSYYSPEILTGATTPDQVWQDWDNHLYYPETGEHNAPTAAARWFNYTRDNFSAGNWEVGFFSFGVLTHYYSDPCIPVHTDEFWPGHIAYEKDINNNLANFELTLPTEVLIDNVSQFVIDSATYSHQYYDTVYNVYTDENVTAIESNAQIKSLTENCLSMAINGSLSLFHTLIQGLDAPDVTITYNYVALFDWAHSNDYTDYSGESKLVSVNQTLARNHFEMRMQTTAFDSASLADVDLLVITCGNAEYTSAELNAIANWAASGNKSIIITGRGDYSTYQDPAYSNDVLEAINAHIRINDDNVYMEGTYQPWYNDLTNIPSPDETLGLTTGVPSITMYSPNSLYFTDDGPVLPIIWADETAYQTDQNAPSIEVIWDNSQNGVNGDQIPLIAVEEIGGLRLLVAGTTFFSDYDYGKATLFANPQLFDNALDWFVNRDSGSISDVDEVGPRISDPTFDPVAPTNGTSVTVSFEVSDPSGVDTVILYATGESKSDVFEMTLSAGVYSVELSDVYGSQVSIKVVANDTLGNTIIREPFQLTWTTGNTTQPTETTVIDTGPGTESLPPILVFIGIGALIAVIVVIVAVKKK